MTFIAGLLLLAASTTFAQTEPGIEIKPLSSNQKPALQVTFAHGTDVDFFVSVTVKGSDLIEGLPFNTLSYRYFDSLTGKYLTEWKLFEKSAVPTRLNSSYLFQASATAETGALELQKSLKSLKLVLLINEGTDHFLRMISLGAFCISNPEVFKDLTTDKNGCEI